MVLCSEWEAFVMHWKWHRHLTYSARAWAHQICFCEQHRWSWFWLNIWLEWWQMEDKLKLSGSIKQCFQEEPGCVFEWYCGVLHVFLLTVTGSSLSLELGSPLMVQWNSWSLWKLMLQGYEPIITEYSSGCNSRLLGTFCSRSEWKQTWDG